MFGCGMGFGRHGGHFWGMPRGIYGLVMASLASGPKSEQEVRDYIARATGIQITYSLEPYLDMLTAYGLLSKSDNKYSLRATPPPAPWAPWWYF